MHPVEGPGEGTIWASVCPLYDGRGAEARPPTPAIEALAAESPCRWRTVRSEDLSGTLPAGARETLV